MARMNVLFSISKMSALCWPERINIAAAVSARTRARSAQYLKHHSRRMTSLSVEINRSQTNLIIHCIGSCY